MRLEERMNRLGFTGKMRKNVYEISSIDGVDGLLLGSYKGGTCYPDGHCIIKNNGSLVAYLSNGNGGTVPVTVHTRNPEKVYGMLSAKYGGHKKTQAKGFLASHLPNIERMLAPYGRIVEKKTFQLNGIFGEARIMYHGSDGDTHCLSIIEPYMRQAVRVKINARDGETLKVAVQDYARSAQNA